MQISLLRVCNAPAGYEFESALKNACFPTNRMPVFCMISGSYPANALHPLLRDAFNST